MIFIIGGRTISLESLGSSMDQAFISLHAAYFGHQALNWADFEDSAMEFFNANPHPSSLDDAYFHNFTVIWNSFLSVGNFDEAERVWEMALAPAN